MALSLSKIAQIRNGAIGIPCCASTVYPDASFRKGSHNLAVARLKGWHCDSSIQPRFSVYKTNSKKCIHFLVRRGRRKPPQILLQSPSRNAQQRTNLRTQPIPTQPQPSQPRVGGNHLLIAPPQFGTCASRWWFPPFPGPCDGSQRRSRRSAEGALLIKAMTSGSFWYLPMLPGLLMMSWKRRKGAPLKN